MMKNIPNSNPADGGTESAAAAQVIDSLLRDSGQKKISAKQAYIILDALAAAEDPSLVARFPAVLAICARNGIELNTQDLFSRYWDTTPERQNMEKLLIISSWLFKRGKIQGPKNLHKIAASFTDKYTDLFSGEICQLSSGLRVSTRDMQAALKEYTPGQIHSTPFPRPERQPHSPELQTYLDRLFSPKQKDLVFKKLRREPFTKTEREYYSRVVRKKLLAIAHHEIIEIATALTRKKNASPNNPNISRQHTILIDVES